jgi:hypothetical protein
VDVKSLSSAVAVYHMQFHSCPPDTLRSTDARFEMSEALVHYLGSAMDVRGRQVGPFMDFRDDSLTDEDGDGFREFRDSWGNPILYARTRRAEDQPRLYHIVSAGPDGKLGGTITPKVGYEPAKTPEGRELEKDNITSF